MSAASLAPRALYEDGQLIKLYDAAYHEAQEEDEEGLVQSAAHDRRWIKVRRPTVVVGGEIVDGKPSAPNEIRGSAIRGGETREIGPGEVLTIPRGVPHWFRSVQAPFRYYVVKSVAGA